MQRTYKGLQRISRVSFVFFQSKRVRTAAPNHEHYELLLSRTPKAPLDPLTLGLMPPARVVWARHRFVRPFHFQSRVPRHVQASSRISAGVGDAAMKQSPTPLIGTVAVIARCGKEIVLSRMSKARHRGRDNAAVRRLNAREFSFC